MSNPTLSLASPAPQRRKRTSMIAIAVAVLVLGGGGVFLAKRGGALAHAKPEDKKVAVVQELSRADYTTVQHSSIQVSLPISGSLTALNQATVRSKVPGEVKEVLAQEGVKVARGQVVMRLDTADLAAHVAAQQAQLDDARAKLALARKTHDNNLTLLKQKYISQTAYDTGQNSVEIAEAAVRSAEAQLDITRRALSDASVRAPMDGVISKRLLLQGEKASPDTPLFSIVDLSQMVLEAPVPASDIPRVHEGQHVSFNVDGFGTREFTGRVVRINPASEIGSRAMTVYISVANKDGALRSGMFAKGSLTLDQSNSVVVLPKSAIRNEAGKSVVYKVDAGKIVAQTVELGLSNDTDATVAVTKGVEDGNQIVIVKLDAIKPGVQVKLPADAGAASAPKAAVATPAPSASDVAGKRDAARA